MVTLQTDRLILRVLRESAFDAYAEMCADPEVMRYIGDGQPLARPLAWRNLALVELSLGEQGKGQAGRCEETGGQSRMSG
jgi:RimJ/RimL family protein N-acetyltransferase